MKKIIVASLIIMMTAYNTNATTTLKNTSLNNLEKGSERKLSESTNTPGIPSIGVVISIEVSLFECGKKISNWSATTIVGQPLIHQVKSNNEEFNFYTTIAQKTPNNIAINYQLTLADKNGKWDDAGELHLTPNKTLRTEMFSNSDALCENGSSLYQARVVATSQKDLKYAKKI
ncbi:hypothetical protein [Dickeya zeae]|uniref:hypothetical protein n=1 Tax=Dickeya zeae TaxID=204042 RepID=UPI001CF461F8|nr:hypothetical protein [Dickeya zeae]MCA6985442.1 hypothetical protein [Dickeya zeae]